MKWFALDIETVPHERTKDWPLVVDDEGVARLESTGTLPSLHPATCRVVQVSFGRRTPSGDIETKICQWDDYRGELDPTPDDIERALLRDALDTLAARIEQGHRIVGFNSKDFDIPLLCWRSRILGLWSSRVLGVRYPEINWPLLWHPYRDESHVDLRLLLGHGDRRARGTLQVWAEAFGVEAHECGPLVEQWVRDERWDELRQYGEREARTLVELYERINPGTCVVSHRTGEESDVTAQARVLSEKGTP